MANQQKLRTRREIMASMMRLLQEKPFSSITVKNIVEESLIHRNTFYNHFNDKYDLLKAIITAKLTDSDVPLDLFLEKPFIYIAKITQASFARVIVKQNNDLEFHETLSQVLLDLVIKNYPDNDRRFWVFGKIAAVFTWLQYTHHKYNITKDSVALDQIYQTEHFPD